MASKEPTKVWTTISYDPQGNILEVRDKYGKILEAKTFDHLVPERGKKCPDGEVAITEVKTIEITYVTCAPDPNDPQGHKDPCWVYDPVTRQWYFLC